MNLSEQNKFRDALREMQIDMNELKKRLEILEMLVSDLSERRGPGRPRKTELSVVPRPK